MQERVVPVAGTTTIEAVEANIEASRVVLSLLSAEALHEALGEALTIESKH
jgi:aryl-alcohol dehydrogenase-like predicted oxidoreductase